MTPVPPYRLLSFMSFLLTYEQYLHLTRSREPTALEAFSRTIRTYVPSSIAIPSATPSPPRVSRPVSFGSFLNPSTHHNGNTQYLGKHRGSDTRADARPTWEGSHSRKPPADGGVFDLDEEVIQDKSSEDGSTDTRYPGVEYSEDILWAGWDNLVEDCQRATRQVSSHLGPHICE